MRFLLVLLMLLIWIVAAAMKTPASHTGNMLPQLIILASAGVFMAMAILTRILELPKRKFRIVSKVLTVMSALIALIAFMIGVFTDFANPGLTIMSVVTVIAGSLAAAAVNNPQFGHVPFYAVSVINLLFMAITLTVALST